MDKIQRIKDLVNDLNKYSYEYYVLDNPSISDKEFDKKYDELKVLESETGYIEQNSPTQKVGNIILDGFKKVQHKNKLWSLDKAQTTDELKDFYNKVNEFVSSYNRSHKDKLPKPEFIITKKFDGLTIKCEYNGGILQQSSTRGTGEIGEDVTEQSKTLVNLPQQINNNNLIQFHGEALMTKRAFEEYNKTTQTPLKNLRNGAAGALRNLNVRECAKRRLSAFFYNVNYSENVEFNSYSQQLDFIKECGLPCDEYKICNTFEEIISEVKEIENQRPNLQYDIDGVVIAVNNIKTRNLMGYTIKFPRYSIAFKFEAEENTTTLLDVEWNTGRTGKITPRAILEPVELMGVTVTKATLNNIDDIKRKNVKIGGRVFVRRSNDVIPEIMGNADDDGIEITVPTHCSACGSELIQDGVHYFCPNTLGCKPQLVKNIVHFCEREAMNIEGFSEKTAEQFIDNGIIGSIIDLYNLQDKKKEIVKLDKFGVKKFNNLIASIEKSKQCKLYQLLYGLGIEGIGIKTAKDLVEFAKADESMDTLTFLRNVSYNSLLKVRDCGEVTARNIVDWFKNEKNIELLDELLKHIEFIDEEKVEVAANVKDNPFKGKRIYPTGKFGLNKVELKIKLEEIGAIVESGYKKSLDYLIAGGDTSKSGKIAKAEKDGVKIVSEEFLMQYIK